MLAGVQNCPSKRWFQDYFIKNVVGGGANGIFMTLLAPDLDPEEEGDMLARPLSALHHVVPALAY